MNTIIDIYNNILVYDKNNINFIIDINNNIWFKFLNISKILCYKSSKDALRDNIDKENKIHFSKLKLLFKKNDHPDTVYINEQGLYTFLINSRQKKAKQFQLWLINDVLPNIRKYGKYEVNKKLKLKLKNLNRKIKLLEKENTLIFSKIIKNFIKNTILPYSFYKLYLERQKIFDFLS